MTDEPSPDSQTRRTRLATRRRRIHVVGVVALIALVAAAVGTATALRNDDSSAPPSSKHALGTTVDPTTPPNGSSNVLTPPRPLSHSDPLRLWIGGDSLAGSFGPALGQIAGATGVVDATVDYKVSSGLADNGVRDWYEHAQQAMASDNPDAVVFIIGTNDTSIVDQGSNSDGEPAWQVDYREKIDRMMETFVGGARHRTVFWLGPPTLGDDTLDLGARELGPVMRQEAAKFAPDVQYVDTYRLFSDSEGNYSSSLPDAQGNLVQMRISDGVHFTVAGAQYLANAVWKQLDKRWDISAQAQPSTPIAYTVAPGSNDYVPGVGEYRPSVSYTSSGTTVPSTAPKTSGSNEPSTTASSTRTTTRSTKPLTTTPPTKPPPVTTPRTTPPPPPKTPTA
ncbi:MAG: DUF459 domain-containing protein [Acidimicrobiia bacterium]